MPLPGPDSATSREVVSLCSNYLQLSVVSDSLLEALELWLLRCAQTLSSIDDDLRGGHFMTASPDFHASEV